MLPLQLPVGEARKLRQRRILLARTRTEVLQGRAIEDKKPEVAQETPISMDIEMNLKQPDVTDLAPPIPKGANNENGKGFPKEQYLPHKGKSITTGKQSNPKYTNNFKGKQPNQQFNLADFAPEPSQDAPSSSEEHWRGLRRPKNPPAPNTPKWDDNKNWSGWKDWNK